MSRSKSMIWSVLFVLVACLMGIFVGCAKTDELSVTITNKETLTAEWHVGDEDRTVEFAFSPEDYNEENTPYSVESNDLSVISVDGTTLHAEGAGKAVVTLKSGSASDSVEITVLEEVYVPVTISIQNKEALTAEWEEESADRMIELAFTAQGQTVEPIEYEVVSSNPEVIAANGTTLSAVGIGTAVITVTCVDSSDHVEITIVPADNGGDWTVVIPGLN